MTEALPGLPVSQAYLLVGRATRLPGKFLMPIGGEPIIAREVRRLREAGLTVSAVTVGALHLPELPVLIDRYDAGPLGGLATILATTHDPFFLFGADMPFVEPAAVRHMVREFDGRTLIPRNSHGHNEVLHAVYANVTAEVVGRLLREGRGLNDLVSVLASKGAVRFLPPGAIPPRSFVDVDTSEEYARWVDAPPADRNGRRRSKGLGAASRDGSPAARVEDEKMRP